MNNISILKIRVIVNIVCMGTLPSKCKMYILLYLKVVYYITGLLQDCLHNI